MPFGRLNVTLHGPLSNVPSARLRSSEKSLLYRGSLARIASLIACASSEESNRSGFWLVSPRERAAVAINVATAKNSRRCISANPKRRLTNGDIADDLLHSWVGV